MKEKRKKSENERKRSERRLGFLVCLFTLWPLLYLQIKQFMCRLIAFNRWIFVENWFVKWKANALICSAITDFWNLRGEKKITVSLILVWLILEKKHTQKNQVPYPIVVNAASKWTFSQNQSDNQTMEVHKTSFLYFLQKTKFNQNIPFEIEQNRDKPPPSACIADWQYFYFSIDDFVTVPESITKRWRWWYCSNSCSMKLNAIVG